MPIPLKGTLVTPLLFCLLALLGSEKCLEFVSGLQMRLEHLLMKSRKGGVGEANCLRVRCLFFQQIPEFFCSSIIWPLSSQRCLRTKSVICFVRARCSSESASRLPAQLSYPPLPPGPMP